MEAERELAGVNLTLTKVFHMNMGKITALISLINNVSGYLFLILSVIRTNHKLGIMAYTGFTVSCRKCMHLKITI